MTHFKIKKGLDLRISGEPSQVIETGNPITRVAVVGRDFVGLKPKMLVSENEHVTLGQPLFTDRDNEGVRYVAPGTGKIIAINRGERRVLQSVVIELDDPNEDAGVPDLPSFSAAGLENMPPAQARELLIESGLWVALRTRPFSRVPKIDASPQAIFVTAIDTNPLAADPQVIIKHNGESFAHGLRVLSRLAEVPVHLCIAQGADIHAPEVENIKTSTFSGPHPAGLAGTHIHFLHPVGVGRTVWTIGYQDVIAIGQLFSTGRPMTERTVALCGPMVERPRLITTRLGAYTTDIVHGETPRVKSRVIAGSVLSGRRASGWGAYLGRRHNQVTVLAEAGEREFMGWIKPGLNKYSAWRIYLANFLRSNARFELNTSQNGSERAMVPTGQYEKVMPQDYLPTQLLRALLVKDTVRAQELGCLELHEEDLALCTFVCPSKYKYGPILRANLDLIEKEG
jgi:Na+-transporting NADH:ubiquinone oxidoreductase subunit A